LIDWNLELEGIEMKIEENFEGILRKIQGVENTIKSPRGADRE
jgi:hypothetical protein